MSIQAINWAFSVRVSNIRENAVLVALAHHHNAKTGKCCPSQATLARETYQSVAMIKKILGVLEDATRPGGPLIRRKHRYGHDGKRTSDEYILLMTTVTSVAVEDGATTAKSEATTATNDADNSYLGSSTNEHGILEKESRPVGPVGDDFLKDFIESYPKRDVPFTIKPVRDALTKAIRDGGDAKVIIANTKRYAAVMSENGKAGTQFVKNPVNWLKEEAWTAYDAATSSGVFVEWHDVNCWCAWADYLAIKGQPMPDVIEVKGKRGA